MALRAAIATGNWSNPAIWNGGVLPGPGDVVASNGYTVTIDQDVNVDSITNAARSIVNAIPTMTSDTTPSGIASGFFTNGGATYYKAFDKDVNNNFFVGNVVAGDYIQYEFAAPIAIDQFAIQFGGSTTTNMSLQAWDGTTWVNLLTASSSSVSVFTSGLAGNSTTYIRYRVVFNTSMYIQLREVYFYEYLGTTAAVAGGTFILNDNRNITCTNGGIIPGATTVLTWSGATGTTSTITTTYIYGATVAGINAFNINGTGTININATTRITGAGTNVTSRTISINANATVNIVGEIAYGPSTSAIVVLVASVCTLNITGTLINSQASGLSILTINTAATVNITGTVLCNSSGTGTNVINSGSTPTLTIVGNMINTSTQTACYCINATAGLYLKILGSISAGVASNSVISSSASAINIFSGPFISSAYGFFPYQVIRMHLIPSVGTYFEFRDETTNGAVSPGAIAPATRMIAPAAVSDAPAVSDVRFGTVYANGSLVGTCKIPPAASVVYGVPVDNTVGSAVLTPQAVWDALQSAMTTPDSIGARIKNCSTVASTAAQLASF